MRSTRSRFVTSIASCGYVSTSCSRSIRAGTSAWPGSPPAPVTSTFTGLAPRSQYVDLARVADHEAVGERLPRDLADPDVLADQAALDARADAADLRALEDDRVLDLALLERDVVGD